MTTKSEFSVVRLLAKLGDAATAQGHTLKSLNALAQDATLLRYARLIQEGRAHVVRDSGVVQVDRAVSVPYPDGYRRVFPEADTGPEELDLDFVDWLPPTKGYDGSPFEIASNAAGAEDWQRILQQEGRKTLRAFLSAADLHAILVQTQQVPPAWRGLKVFALASVVQNEYKQIGDIRIPYLHCPYSNHPQDHYEIGWTMLTIHTHRQTGFVFGLRPQV